MDIIPKFFELESWNKSQSDFLAKIYKCADFQENQKY